MNMKIYYKQIVKSRRSEIINQSATRCMEWCSINSKDNGISSILNYLGGALINGYAMWCEGHNSIDRIVGESSMVGWSKPVLLKLASTLKNFEKPLICWIAFIN